VRRAAPVVAALCSAVVAPAPPLPPVDETDAVDAFVRLVAAGPAVHRAALRAALALLDLAPLALGERGRLRDLPPGRRDAVVQRLERGPVAPAMRPLRSLLHLAYYGDARVLRTLGYDSDAVIRRANAA
jgi:hypothetical protein